MILYGLKTCETCRKAIKALEKAGVVFTSFFRKILVPRMEPTTECARFAIFALLAALTLTASPSSAQQLTVNSIHGVSKSEVNSLRSFDNYPRLDLRNFDEDGHCSPDMPIPYEEALAGKGSVTLLFDYDENGIPTNIRIVSSDPPGVFDEVAISVLRKCYTANPSSQADENQIRTNVTATIYFKPAHESG